MSKRIKPNVEHRIVDGEVISGSIDEKILRGQSFSQEKAQEHSPEESVNLEMPADMNKETTNFINDEPIASVSNGDDVSNTKDKSMKKPSFFSKYRSTLLWLLMFIIVIVVLFVTRPNNDWQIQKINDLQSEINQLKEDNLDLNNHMEKQQANMQKMITEQVNAATQNLAVNNESSTTDSSVFEQKIQQQIDVLHKEMSSLTGAAAKQANKALAEINQLADNAQKSLPSSAEQEKALKELDAKLQSQMANVSDKLKELFNFKTEQQVLSKKPNVLKLDMPLDSLQIQQWIVEVNTQWILNGRADETQQQLLALEQAVSLSDFKYTTQLARLIGQDLGYLKQVKEDQLRNPLPQTTELKDVIAKLTAKKIKNGNSVVKTAEQDSSTSINGLLSKFSEMFTVKKRTEDGAVTQVDDLLENDVLQQRLSLLVDRLDWGMQTQSLQTVKQATADIKAFIKRHYSQEATEFNLLLEPFLRIQFPRKQNLSIINLDETIEH
ncbi:hypothetical protein JCM30760_25820 [Thiomicrorhabdus hydrogeniphila]